VIYIHGPSSIGKTIAGRAGLSTFAPLTAMRQWTATINAIEKELESANDSFELRDELTAVNVWVAREIFYRGFTGSGRSRLTRDAKLREAITWRAIMSATGEPSPDDILREARGDQRGHLGGQDVRLISFRVDRERLPHGVFETAKTVAEGEKAEQRLRQAVDECHGVAGWAFIERLIQEFNSQEDFKATLTKRLTEMTGLIVGGNKVGEEARRVARHLAHVALAGELASEWNIVDWQEGTATRAASQAFDWWVEDRGDGQASRGQLEVIDILKRSLMIDRARWQLTGTSTVPRDRLGFIDPDASEVWLPHEALRLLFGANASIAPKALKDADLIKRRDRGLMGQCSPPVEKRRRFYVLSLTKLTGDENEYEAQSEQRTIEDAWPYIGAIWVIVEQELDRPEDDPSRQWPRPQVVRFALMAINAINDADATTAWLAIDTLILAGRL
jgi:hypothetical protein